MAVNSFLFWLVFPFIFLLYWVIPSSKHLLKKCFLILVSYLIYMSFFAWHALVLMYVTVITYWGARIIEKKEKRRKATIWALLSASFAPKFFFKYLDFMPFFPHVICGMSALNVVRRRSPKQQCISYECKSICCHTYI